MAEVVGYSVEDNSDIEKSVIDAAKKHFSNGSYDSALKLYLGLLKTSASARLYFDVGLCYYKKNDYDKAIELGITIWNEEDYDNNLKQE